MARDIESLTLRMSADLRRFEKSMANMSAIADKRLTAVERQALRSQRNLARTMERAGSDMVAGLQRGLADLAPVLAGAFSVAQVARYADAWTAGRNSLAAAGVATADLAARQEELLRIANESRTSTEATIGLYSRLSIATQELGLSSEQTLRLTDLLNKSFASSGGSAQEAASAALQLSQALASGTLQGDELRSLRENAPLIAKAIADSMGVGIGALKKLGAEGKITAEVVTQALFAASGEIEARFQSTQVTVGQALTVLDNQLGAFVGRADEGLSATQRLAEGIVALANNLDDAADVVIVAATAIGVTLASRAIGGAVVSFTALRAQVALTNAQLAAAALQAGLASGALGRMSVAGVAAAGSMRGLSAAMAFFGGPIGLVLTGLATGIALIATNVGRAEREVKALAEEIDRQASAAQAAADQTARLGGEITATERWAAALTGQTDLLADAHYRAAAAAKAQAIEEARLRVVQGRETLEQARTAYDARYRRERQRFGVDPSNGRFAGIEGPNANVRERTGEAIVRTQEYNNLVGATANLNRFTGELVSLMNAPLARPTPAGGGGGDGGRAPGGGGRNTADAEARRREREAEQAAAEERRRLEEEIDRLIQGSENRLAARTEAREHEARVIRDQLETTAELARLSGDPAAAAAAERELWINERINELLNDRLEITEAAARARATGEANARDAAAATGAAREAADYQGREMARSFVDILASDDIWEAAGRRFRDAAFDQLENLLTQIFAQIGNGSGGGAGGWVAAIANFFTGGRKAATGRSGVTAGYPVLVGEKRPEVFVPSVSGSIIPSVNAAMAGAQQRQGGLQRVLVELALKTDMLDARIDGRATPIAKAASAQMGQTVLATSRRAAPALDQRRRRLGTT